VVSGIGRSHLDADSRVMLSMKERQRLLVACAAHGKRFDAIAAQFDHRARLGPALDPEPDPGLQPGIALTETVSDRSRPAIGAATLDGTPTPGTGGSALSARELEVLTLISSGFTNTEIGRRLFVSEETVKTHSKKILLKLEARNRAHAGALAVQRGLVELVAG
jgi:DNA-binding CsgD family transcriptional regulator